MPSTISDIHLFTLEKIKVLKETHPSLYDRFTQGYFVVRDRENAFFSAVAGDMKLEQSINRFSKGQGGYVCVGSSGDISTVSEFELLFHEVLAISNSVTLIMKDDVMGHLETNIQHTLTGRKGMIFHKNVIQLFDVVNGKGNPYKITLPLHNILTMATVNEETKKRVLNVLKDGELGYLEFRKERYVERESKLSATISKVKLPLFSATDQNKHQDNQSNNKNEITSKDQAEAERRIKIAEYRGLSRKDIFMYDVLEKNTMPVDGKSNKAQLVVEIEANLLKDVEMPQYTSKSPLLTHVVVDVMSTVRQYGGFSGGKTFGEAIQSIFNTTSHIAEHDPIHLLFDSYTDLSIKCSERNHRKGEIDSIEHLSRRTHLYQH